MRMWTHRISWRSQTRHRGTSRREFEYLRNNKWGQPICLTRFFMGAAQVSIQNMRVLRVIQTA